MDSTRSQADLFQIPRHLESDAGIEGSSFLERYKVTLRLDQLLLCIIILGVLHLFTYTLGIEAGKRSTKELIETERVKNKQALLHLSQQLKVPAEEKVVVVEKTPVAEVPAVPDVLPPTASSVIAAEKGVQGSFTIQLVTYNSEKQANEQITELTKKGLEAFLVPSGRFFQVCVNGFESKKMAIRKLSQLRIDGIAPRDAYVRRMPAAVFA